MNGVNLFIDTNIIIYYFKGRVDARSLIENNDITISYITALEVLGYWNNTEEHNEFIQELLSTFKIIYSNERILKEAIELKRNYKLSTPDSIIGATSIIEKIPLLTGDKKNP